jgi:hypothetical protein
VKVRIVESNDESDALLDALLNSAPVEWQYLVTAKPETLGRCITGLDALMEKSARLRGYLDGRYGHGCGDQGHKDAVKMSNRLLNKVRKALGFIFPRQDLSF